MLNYWIYFGVSCLIPAIMILVPFFILRKTLMQETKMASFECGFDYMMATFLPFSLRFFVLALIFVIFDVEIALILPALLDLSMNPSQGLVFFVFLGILWVGTVYEWANSELDWKE
uniref:NADH-ubiquinone oxidoreductase chain 3 n=1 Tax=Janira maculosa TaxID=155701 RepID=E3SXB2_9CRUS|nr:NADH dehydrogenase subunit 3 [Janira maculosa]